ncbi:MULTISPECIES: helix-turn-helix transcriptional regulator [Campylobacterales]|uniref:helix-turn-helix transcriptional regulator n=1 Tax=Campylobacterales TaxID=213849 RepID=UPI003D040F44
MEENIDKFLDEIVLKVKEERIKRNISQLALAEILGHKSPNYVAKIETRKHDVSYNLSHLYKIAYEFGIEVTDLIPHIKSPLK